MLANNVVILSSTLGIVIRSDLIAFIVFGLFIVFVVCKGHDAYSGLAPLVKLIDALVGLTFFVWSTLVIINHVSFCGFLRALFGSNIYCHKTTLTIILWITLAFIVLSGHIVVMLVNVSVSFYAFWGNICGGNVYCQGTSLALRQFMVSGFRLLLLGWGPHPFGFWWCHGLIQHNNGVGVDNGKGSVGDGDHCRVADECGSGGDRQQWRATMANNVIVDSDEGGDG